MKFFVAIVALLAILGSVQVDAGKPQDVKIYTVAENPAVKAMDYFLTKDMPGAAAPFIANYISQKNTEAVIAAHEAINSIKQVYKLFYGGVRVNGNRKNANLEAAFYTAIKVSREIALPKTPKPFDTGSFLFDGTNPTTQAYLTSTLDKLRTWYAERIAEIVDTPKNIQDGIDIGTEAAQMVADIRSTAGNWDPIPTADPECSATNGKWCQFDPNNATLHLTTGGFAYTNLGQVKPFIIDVQNNYQVPPPPTTDSGLFLFSAQITRLLGAINSPLRNADLDAHGSYYAQGAGGFLALRTFKQLWVQNDRQVSLFEGCANLGLLFLANSDSAIHNTYTKVKYLAIRPYQAITTGQPAQILDSAWKPRTVTPANAEFLAGHPESIITQSAVMQHIFGWDAFPRGPIIVSSSDAPTAAKITLHSFTEYMHSVNVGRIVNGMHFLYSVESSLRYGPMIARQLIDEAFVPL